MRSRLSVPPLTILLIAAVLSVPAAREPGYSLDEEITTFAVQGIEQYGLPLFPSGVVSDRGVPFSYAAWLAGAVFGHTLLSYRLVSVLSALAAVAIVYLLARWLAGEVAAISAAALLAIFPIHVAVSGWARFYALAVAAFSGSVALFLVSERRPALRRWFVASVAVSALLHELCFTLLALPILAVALSRDDTRENTQRRIRTAIACAAAVALAKLAVVGLHFLAPNQALNPWLYQSASSAAPSRLGAMLAAVTLSSVWTLAALAVLLLATYVMLARHPKMPRVFLLVCMLTGLFFQLGILAAATLTAILLRSARMTTYLVLAGATALASSMFWTLHTWMVTSAALTTELFRSLIVYSASYPLAAAFFFGKSLPLTSLAVTATIISTLRRSPGQDDRHVRLLSALLLLSLLSLGAANIPLNSRYYLVFWPIAVLLLGYGVERLWRSGSSSAARGLLLGRMAALFLVAALALEHRVFSRENPVLMTGGTPDVGTVERVASENWSEPLSSIPEDAQIISNDELAAVYHIGRVDYWLTTNEWDLARYELVTASGRYGEYAGARVISSADDLRSVMYGDTRPAVVVLFRTGRFEYDAYRQMVVELSAQDSRTVTYDRSGLFILRVRMRN